MGQAVLLALLPPLEEGAPPALTEQHAAIFPADKIGFLKDPVVDAGQHEPVCHAGAKFLHQI